METVFPDNIILPDHVRTYSPIWSQNFLQQTFSLFNHEVVAAGKELYAKLAELQGLTHQSFNKWFDDYLYKKSSLAKVIVLVPGIKNCLNDIARRRGTKIFDDVVLETLFEPNKLQEVTRRKKDISAWSDKTLVDEDQFWLATHVDVEPITDEPKNRLCSLYDAWENLSLYPKIVDIYDHIFVRGYKDSYLALALKERAGKKILQIITADPAKHQQNKKACFLTHKLRIFA